MYTRTVEDRDKLNTIMIKMVMPAIQRALTDAARELVYEVEGFHPDVAYGESMGAAADELTVLLCDYFAGVSYMSEEGLYEKISAKDLLEWLKTRTDTVPKVSVSE